MGDDLTMEGSTASPPATNHVSGIQNAAPSKPKSKSKDKDAGTNKRRCVSTACIACRRRKSKCDGNLPKCAACASVYLTDCQYAPHTDHRRKGVYKKDSDHIKTKNTTLQVLIQALLNAEEEEDAFELVRQIRSCDSLEDFAQALDNREQGIMDTPDSPIYGDDAAEIPQFEAELSGKMGDLYIDGAVKFVGGTSNLIWLTNASDMPTTQSPSADGSITVRPREEAVLGWTTVTRDKELIFHFMNMYFCWHYAYFTTLSKELFYRDFLTGTDSQHCSSLLVNAMLALGCHFSARPAARAIPEDSSTTGDHYFAEAKKLLHADDEFGIPKLCTVQALALMSVREAGCGRESKGWIYSGMSFRLASDLGLNIDAGSMNDKYKFSDEEIDARRITFWGCFLFDKCWSNYLGRQPQFLQTTNNVKKPDVFGVEDAEQWSPYTDSGVLHNHSQPARTRAVSLQISQLAEISSDLLSSFYQPQLVDKPNGKQSELKRLSDLHTRLEAWKKDLPAELEAKDGQLPQVLLMHMFYQLLYIHLYRPFLKYTKTTSPLPNHVSPRKFCTQGASSISKLFRLYKRTHGLRQICNIAVYIAHSACTIHLLNLPEKNAKRDIIHGVKQLEEIGENWVCARRTLRILGLCAERWKIELPEEAQATLDRTSHRWGPELSPAPLSPEAMSTVAQLEAQPVSDILARNLSQYQHLRHYPRQDLSYAGLPPVTSTMYAEPITSMAQVIESSPATGLETPNVEDENYSNQNRPKISLQLTQAQQDAWNALQAKMGLLTPSGARTPNEQPVNAAVMFGGVDSLIEESQDWWYNDQSQIALGFDNWNAPANPDWNQVGGHGNMPVPMNSGSEIQIPAGENAAQLMTTPQRLGSSNHRPTMSPTLMMAGYRSIQAQQHPQSMHQVHQHAQSTNESTSPRHRLQSFHQRGTAQKRSGSPSDDIMYQ